MFDGKNFFIRMWAKLFCEDKANIETSRFTFRTLHVIFLKHFLKVFKLKYS
jgi:hypothetical protein